jgi:hypothetical protein
MLIGSYNNRYVDPFVDSQLTTANVITIVFPFLNFFALAGCDQDRRLYLVG